MFCSQQDYWKISDIPHYEDILFILNTGFTILFTLECIVKMVGFGFLVRFHVLLIFIVSSESGQLVGKNCDAESAFEVNF